MNSVYLHSKYKYDYLIKLISFLLIPFLIVGLYKNGISLYKHNLISKFELIKPILFLLSSLIISFVIAKIFKKRVVDYPLLVNLLIVMIMPYNTSIITYLIVVIILNIINLFVKFNYISLFMIINFVILHLMHKYTFLNPLELSLSHSYSFFDYLIGKGPGGVANTFLLGSIISIVVLSMNMGYKKYIPLTGFVTYYILLTITGVISSSFSYDLFLNNNLIFAFIFICPLPIYSTYSKGGCYISGLLLGLLCYLSSFISIDIGLYVSILLVSLISPLIDKIIVSRKVG